MKAWLSKNWQILLLLAAVGYVLYDLFGPQPSDALIDHLEAENDSLLNANKVIQLEMIAEQELRKKEQEKQKKFLQEIDSLKNLKPINKLEYEKANKAIFNSTDTGFVRYLSEREIPTGYTE